MIHTKESRILFFICLSFLFLGAFSPIIYLLIRAFLSEEGLSAASQFLFPGNRHYLLLKSTMAISLGASIGSIIFGAPVAYALSRLYFPARSFFLLLCPVPLLVPPYVHTISWNHLLASYGFTSQLKQITGQASGGTSALILCVWIMVLAYYPVVTLLSYIGFSQMDANLEDAGRIHSRPSRVIRLITLKLALPSILAGGLFVFILALSNFGVPSMLGVHVFSLEVFYQFSTLHKMDQAAIYALPILILSLIALTVIHRMEKNPRFIISSSSREINTTDPGKIKWVVTCAFLFLYVLSIFIPIKVLLEMAGPWENYLAVISNARQDILISFWTSVSAAFFALIIGTILAFMVWGSPSKAGNRLEKICILSFAFPAAATGIGIIGLWNRGVPFQWVYSSTLILIMAYFSRYISFAFKPVRLSISYIDSEMDESARVIGIPWWKRFFYLLTPINMKGLMVAWFIVYLFSITDLGTSILVLPPGKGTMPVRIFNLLHFGHQEWVGALCLVLIALVVIPYVMIILLSGKEKNGDPS